MNIKRPVLNTPVDSLAIGKIIEVDGSHIVVELHRAIDELVRVHAGEIYSIGQFGSIIQIPFGRKVIYALVGRLRMKTEYETEKGIASTADADERVVEADLFGEGSWSFSSTGDTLNPELKFQRGVGIYPLPQQTVFITPKSDLKIIYGDARGNVMKIGEHVGSGGAACYAEINELLGKHTAILGSTGAGKSGAVAAIVHGILDRGNDESYGIWNPRIVILDPHNEYGGAFMTHTKLSTDDGTLLLPYWMLNFQETIALIIGKTEYVATSQANIIKRALLEGKQEGANVIGFTDSITVDSPVPYSLDVLYRRIDADKPSAASKQDSHNSILQKIDALRTDSRFNFMMEEWSGSAEDPLPEILERIVGGTAQPRVIDLSGVPNEVAGVCSAVIARTLFNLKVWQSAEERANDPVLLVCEEAHRYVPNSGEAQYEAAQDAIRRIAKEGRKYGIGLLLVSQRPSEVEATVLSQCNTWLVLRITNDVDRGHVRSILPDTMGGLTKMLSGLRRQEAIFVGQAAMLPSRIMINTLPPDRLPRSNDIDFDRGWQSEPPTTDSLTDLSNRWRKQSR